MLARRQEASEPRFDPKGGRVKAERWIHALLWAARYKERGLPYSTVMAIPRYDDDAASVDALEKRWDRDKVELRKLGLHIGYRSGDHMAGEGYTLRVEDPPFPDEILEARKTRVPRLTAGERFVQILWVLDKGWRVTVAQLADYLRTDEATVQQDIDCLICCGAGPEPHQMLDIYIEDGYLKKAGPGVYA